MIKSLVSSSKAKKGEEKKLKTYFRDYSLGTSSLAGHNYKLSEVMDQRQAKYELTSEYQEAASEALTLLKELSDIISKKGISELEEAFYKLQWLCFEAGYKDGIADTMTALTFNEVGLTKVEYINFAAESASTG